MPAMLDDPTAPVIYRMSGQPPYPLPNDNGLPDEITPRQVTLRDRVTIATLLPFSSPSQVPPTLLAYLSDQLNREIEKGDTYPMYDPLPLSNFGPYWFQNFGAIMVLGELESVEELHQMEGQGTDWAKVALGSFYVKPNYPGRSSHVCNGGFLVTDAARNKGVGRLMGEVYLEWAPKLGYTYSVFNLVYETNVASCRIWDALGFKRIGRVKGCGNLRSHPDQLIDAIIFGRDLDPEGEDFVSEERFDKIRYYLKQGKYPAGADRAEKSRLRSAATHYKLLPPETDGGQERLMLKDKEVVSDPQRQYEIARHFHSGQHGGINKTTAIIAERYHWVRIKETVSLAIKNCPECKESTKNPIVKPETMKRTITNSISQPKLEAQQQMHDPNGSIERLVDFNSALGAPNSSQQSLQSRRRSPPSQQPDYSNGIHPSQTHVQPQAHNLHLMDLHAAHMQQAPVVPMQSYADLPLDPQIMGSVSHLGLQNGLSFQHQDAYGMDMSHSQQAVHMDGVDHDHHDGVLQQQLEMAGFGRHDGGQ